jgi:P4 family phage/plasmid primase-like protien
MNIQMTSSQFKDLNEFLAKHSAKNDTNKHDLLTTNFTHTRIPDKDLNIYGGTYIIPSEELQTFYGLYYNSIFVQKRKEYLTEKQLTIGGPMAVDFDFRYNNAVTSKQYTPEHICDMVCEYSEQLKECYLIEPDKSFDVFIFEKPNVNRLADGSLTKDGIHMIIGIQIDHCMQTLIRDKMVEQLANVWQDIPLINTWDSVLDEGISKGITNWQLFGSRKPGNEAYELTHHYIMTIDAADGEFKMDEEDVAKFDLKKDFAKLSVQYDKHPKFEINPNIIDEYNKRITNKSPKVKKASSKIKMNLLVDNDDDCDSEDYISINDIKDKETLERAINLMLKNLSPNEYELKETHEFTQALSSKYYNPGSHILNRQVAFALKHTDERLFLSWIQLRSKAADFDYNSIPELYTTWKKFSRSNNVGGTVTRKSIMYWVRKDNPVEYEKIKQTTTDYYLEKAFETATEYDLAMVLKQMYKERYVCVSYDKKGIWYQFRNHRWVTDKGLSLRSKISEELYVLFASKVERLQKEMFEYQEDDERKIFLQKKIKIIVDLSIKLKRTNDKNNIMREAAEIFYDDEFIRSMDTNKYLMCFNNGVVDFNNKVFREGYPEDYITKSTKINYIPYDESNSEFKTTVSEIDEFMNKLFPVPDLNRYMHDHLASCLIGANKNQTFNIYHGSGSNGKSILADLMSVTLGEYKGTVPITLVTDVRGKIGGTSDEVLKLKGVRYAVMQEPSKGVKLNDGIMKELTGGDPLQARGLYSESEIFEPQFNLVVCTNSLFDIETADDGTWRRIRKCDFMSKFVDEGETHTDDTPYIYPKDKSLKEKLPLFAPIFASMLVKRAFETEGIVENCSTVENASSKYRKGQDHIAAFISEMIVQVDNPNKYLNKSGLNQALKKWYEETQGSRKVPKAEELHECMNKKFGKCKPKGWSGLQFYEPDEDDSILEEL